MRLRLRMALVASLLPALSGCHSRYIEATVANHTLSPIPLIEVDYPSASFGTQNLAVGAVYVYRFKILGAGPVKLLYTDAAHQDHTASGPMLNEGMEGKLTIDLDPAGAHWNLAPQPPH